MPVKVKDLGYIAGVIDSDGYIGLARQKENRRRGNITESYKPMVTVTQAQPEAVDFIKSLLGGNNGVNKSRNGNHRPLYRWGVYSNKKTREFLEVIEPYLKIKRKQAQLVIQFCLLREKALQNKTILRDNQGHFLKGSSKNTYTGVEEGLWRQVLKLNQTGGIVNESSKS